MKSVWLAFFLLLLGPGRAWAHGGTYAPPRPPPWAGPKDTPGSPAGPRASGSGPARPAPSGVPAPTTPYPASTPLPRSPFPPPMTSSPDEILEPALWQVWWSYNHDAFLDVRGRVQALAAASPENLVVAERRRLQELLLPALLKSLETGDAEMVGRQKLLALARLAKVRELDVALDRMAGHFLGEGFRDHPMLQEAALLALGVGGDLGSVELLRHVLMDDAKARELLAQEAAVPTRMRVFAAYSLGLLGRRDPSESSRRQVVHALLFALGHEGAVERELRVACTLAIGLVPIQPCTTPEEALDPARQIEELHLCGGTQTEYLLAIVNDSTLDPWFRGHAAASIGRLAANAGRGLPATEDHPLVPSREDLVLALLELAQAKQQLPQVVHGCLLGLGAAVDGDADTVDDEARKFLTEMTRRGEPMAQRFALVSLALALGRPGAGAGSDEVWREGSTLLLREFSRAKETSLPRHALAPAIAGHRRSTDRQALPDSHLDTLRTRLAQSKNANAAAAFALGIALLDPEDSESRAALRASFEELESPFFRTYGALALGMLGAADAKEPLEKALEAPEASAEERIAASVGLRLLGETDAVRDLVARLEETGQDQPAEALAIVNALALLGDPFAGEPMLELLLEGKCDDEVRAAMVWCLGVLADPNAPDWTASYANGLDYNFMPWTLKSPNGDGRGLLDWR